MVGKTILQKFQPLEKQVPGRYRHITRQGSGATCLRAETHRQATKDPRCLGNVEPQNKEY